MRREKITTLILLNAESVPPELGGKSVAEVRSLCVTPCILCVTQCNNL